MGMAYIRFAKEEPELFKLLFMRDRSAENQAYDGNEMFDGSVDAVSRATGVSRERAVQIHAEMWLFVHGIACQTAGKYFEWDDETVSNMLTDVYLGISSRKTGWNE